MNTPNDVTVDAAGNIYFSDYLSNVVRKINTAGIISTVAGTGIAGYTGDGGPATTARLRGPAGIEVYGGELFISDQDNNVLRKVSATGIITTVAGTGTAGYSGDNGPPTAAKLNRPNKHIHDAGGNIYIVDFNNHAVRKVLPYFNLKPTFTAGHSATLSICPNSTANPINSLLAANDVETGQTETWSIVSPPTHGTAITAYTTTSTGGVMTPTGLSYTPASGYSGSDLIVVQVVDCGGVADTITISITITPLASAGVITGSSFVCSGSTIALTNATTGGVWSSSNTNVSVSSTGIVTGITAGTSTISYTITGTCGATVAMGSITVLNMPDPISGPTNICTGSTLTLSDAASGGLWSSTNTSVATAIPGSGVVFGVKAGTAVISYTIGGVCSVNTTINVDPPLPAIQGPGRVCEGNTVTLSDSVTFGVWSASSAYVTVNPVTGDVFGVSKGTGTITYSVSNGCIAVKSFTVNPNPRPIVLASTTMCYSDKGVFAAEPDTGGVWTSWLVTVATSGYLEAFTTGAGLITYTFLSTGCYTTAPITVMPLPGLITGTNSICEGQLSALTDTSAGGTWSTTDPAVLVDIYTGGLYGASPGTAVVTYQLPTTCFVVDTITVNPSPTPILGTRNVCIGGTTLLSDALTGGSWSISAGGYGSIDATTGAATGLMAGSTTVSYTSGIGCSITAPLTVLPLPLPFTVSGGGHYCAGGTGVHVTLSGSVTGVKYYLFSTGMGLEDSLMGTTASLDYGLRTTPGVYTVYAVNTSTQCGNSMTSGATVVADPVLSPIVSITTVPGDTVCTGSPLNCIAGSVYGGTAPAYQWKVNGIPVGTAGTYSYTPVDGDLVGVELTSSEACVDAPKAYAFRTVAVVDPVVPIVTLSADPGTSVVEGTTVTYTATITNKVTAPTYQWLKNGAIVTAATGATFTDNSVHNFDTVSCRVWSGGFCSLSAIERLHMNVYKNDGANVGVHSVTGTDATIRVIPNPSKGAFTVTGSLGIATDEQVTLELTDMLGRTIYNGTTIAKNGVISTEVQLNNTIASGTYLLNVRSGATRRMFHIIVEQ